MIMKNDDDDNEKNDDDDNENNNDDDDNENNDDMKSPAHHCQGLQHRQCRPLGSSRCHTEIVK